MFLYCVNNPVCYSDSNGRKAEKATNLEENEENDSYRFVGIGFQGELDVGGYEVGVEVIVYYDPLVCGGEEPVVAVYTYEGAFVDIDDIKKSVNYTATVAKLTLAVTTNKIDEQNAEVLLIALQQALFSDVGVSGSVVGVFGNGEFNSTRSYKGPFNAFSGIANHLKVSVAYCSSCFTVAVGGTTDKFGASFGQSNYTQIY